MENCCESLVKYFMVFFNILFTIAGCVLLGFGAWSQVDAKNYLNFLGDNYVQTPIFLMVVGGVIFAVAFLGCCGACRESKCLIHTYACLLAVIIVAQVGAGIAAFLLKGDLDVEVTKNMEAGMTNYGNGAEFDGVTKAWDIVQENYECCGVQGQADWHAERPDRFNVTETPDSCCKGGHVAACGADAGAAKFQEGCYGKFKDFFVDNIAIVGGAALGVAAVELVIVLLACCIGRRMGRGEMYV